MRLVISLLLAAAFAREGWACAPCNCGDPTLTATGVEKPYKNRLRLSLEERFTGHSQGLHDRLAETLTLRSALALSWVPTPRISLNALLPWITQWATRYGQRQTINGLGELELSARTVLYWNRKFSPDHLLWASAGLKFPTAPRVFDSQGYPIPDDDQPGSGSWDPFASLTYAWFGGLTTVYVSTSYRQTTPTPRGTRFGSVFGWSAAVQLQPFTRVALVLGVDGRWAQADKLANGNDSPDTGGVVMQMSPALLISPWRSLLIRLAAGVPVVKKFSGVQSEQPSAIVSLAYDIL